MANTKYCTVNVVSIMVRLAVRAMLEALRVVALALKELQNDLAISGTRKAATKDAP